MMFTIEATINKSLWIDIMESPLAKKYCKNNKIIHNIDPIQKNRAKYLNVINLVL